MLASGDEDARLGRGLMHELADQAHAAASDYHQRSRPGGEARDVDLVEPVEDDVRVPGLPCTDELVGRGEADQRRVPYQCLGWVHLALMLVEVEMDAEL